MRRVLSQRLFPLLQLTRMALVFTAISNSLCTLLLLTRRVHGPRVLEHLSWEQVLVVIATSVGLYSFGMSLNDIIDRRRDRELAAHRPLPSGRIGVATAHIACVMFGLLAVLGGAAYTRFYYGTSWMPLVLVVWTGLLITFYDFAGKYLVALGLLTLGMIRLFHAAIPAPGMPLLWHPLLLLNHTTILSLVAYKWEQKRPALSRIHWWTVLGGLLVADVLLVGLYAMRAQLHHQPTPASIVSAMWIRKSLIAPLVASAIFALFAILLRRKYRERQAGQMLMLYGLLWLIVYDVTFVAGYVNLTAAAFLLLLLPLAYGSVQIMRWWGKLISLSQRPHFRRAMV